MFRRRWWAKLPSRPKPRGSNPTFQGSRLGYDPWAIDVTGGVAWTKWLTTLTGESPTSSVGRQAAAVRPSYKSQAKCEVDAMERGRRLASPAKGRQLFRSSRETDAMQMSVMKGRTVRKEGAQAKGHGES